MPVIPELPRDTRTDGYEGPKCPWCKQNCGEATVTLEALDDAHKDDSLSYARREDGLALRSECPGCGKPFLVALQFSHWDRRFMRLLAVRTDTDLRLLGEAD